jgi:endonuclease YncB( thermonuclease family)
MPTHRRGAIRMHPRLPGRRPAALPVLAILGAIAAAMPAARAAERKNPGPASSPRCTLQPFAFGTVQAVVDGRTFALADGREVRLAGIEVPPPPGPSQVASAKASATATAEDSATAQSPSEAALDAAAALAALVSGNEVVITHAREVTDRYGRVLADALVSRDGTSVSVTKSLLAQGLARVAARPGDAVCAADLRTAERTARAAKLGVWGDPRYFPKQAENVADISAERGRFTLVEGKVVSVRESGGTIYVNFGKRWSEDFTVTILKRNERVFAAAGLEPSKLAGRRVMVRGWIEERGGPWIDAAGPEQIEVMADK